MARKILRYILLIIAVLIAIGAIIYVFLVWRSQPMPDHPFFARDDVLVIAHQGGDGLRPSNTMAAFENAAALGVDVLEMDIHSTSDGVLVVIHDDTVDRTTDGTGRVVDYTIASLKRLDAGYDFPTLEDSEINDHPYRGQGITIPMLEEVLEAFHDYPMIIEIKQSEPPIVQPFCELLRDYERTDLTVVASFDAQTMYDFREECPEVPTSGVETEIRPFVILNTLSLGATYQPTAYAFQVPEYFGDTHVVTQQFVDVAHRHNIDVQVWTVNEVEDMQRMIDLGVDGIMTDYPDRLLALLGRDN